MCGMRHGGAVRRAMCPLGTSAVVERPFSTMAPGDRLGQELFRGPWEPSEGRLTCCRLQGVPQKQERQMATKKLRELFRGDTAPVDDVANEQRRPQPRPVQWPGQVYRSRGEERRNGWDGRTALYKIGAVRPIHHGPDKYVSVPSIRAIRAIGLRRSPGSGSIRIAHELLPRLLQLFPQLRYAAGRHTKPPGNIASAFTGSQFVNDTPVPGRQ